MNLNVVNVRKKENNMENTFYKDREANYKLKKQSAKFGCICMIVLFSIRLAIMCGIGYTVIHFIKKFW